MTRLNPITTPPPTARREGRRNKKALDAFIGKKAEIDAMLARLARPQRRPFRDPPRRDRTGAMSAPSSITRSLLKRITDSAFKEGEHAE